MTAHLHDIWAARSLADVGYVVLAPLQACCKLGLFNTLLTRCGGAGQQIHERRSCGKGGVAPAMQLQLLEQRVCIRQRGQQRRMLACASHPIDVSPSICAESNIPYWSWNGKLMVCCLPLPAWHKSRCDRPNHKHATVIQGQSSRQRDNCAGRQTGRNKPGVCAGTHKRSN